MTTIQTESTDPDFLQLAAEVAAVAKRLQVPGVAIGVHNDGSNHIAGYGITNIEAPVPVDGHTLFQIGSTTKTFTATAAMRLVEEGKLDLDSPVCTYLPDLQLADQEAAKQVTLRQLFNHSAGWLGDFFDDTGRGDDALAIIVERMRDLPQLTPLGQFASYNNAGFYLAGRVLEAVTGKPYETVIQEYILDPLGMTESFFFAEDCISRRVVSGHLVNDGKTTVMRPWALARSAHAAGGITSTAHDQLIYAQFHLGDGTAPDGTRLLSAESLAEMQTPRIDAGSAFGKIGVSWMIKVLDGVKTVRHGGTTSGQLSAFVLVPEQRFALTVLTNATTGGQLHNEIVKWALRHYFNIGESALTPVQRSAEELEAYVGKYTAAGSDLEITVKDQTLVMQVIPKGGFPTKDTPPRPAPPPTRLLLAEDDFVVAQDAPLKDAQGEFLRDDADAVAWLRFGGRMAKRVE